MKKMSLVLVAACLWGALSVSVTDAAYRPRTSVKVYVKISPASVGCWLTLFYVDPNTGRKYPDTPRYRAPNTTFYYLIDTTNYNPTDIYNSRADHYEIRAEPTDKKYNSATASFVLQKGARGTKWVSLKLKPKKR